LAIMQILVFSQESILLDSAHWFLLDHAVIISSVASLRDLKK